jgi:hypothetical protein
MKAVPPLGVIRGRSRRNAAVVIADPHLLVVESSDHADPGAIEDALELLVKWAIRAQRRSDPASGEAVTVQSCATCESEN